MDLPSRPEAPGLPQGLRGPGLRGREGAPSRARAEPGQAGGTASAPPSRGRSRALEGHSSLPRGLRGAQPGSVIPAPHHPGTALAVMPTAQGLSERLTGDRKPGTFRAQQRNPLWGVSPHPAGLSPSPAPHRSPPAHGPASPSPCSGLPPAPHDHHPVRSTGSLQGQQPVDLRLLFVPLSRGIWCA